MDISSAILLYKDDAYRNNFIVISLNFAIPILLLSY